MAQITFHSPTHALLAQELLQLPTPKLSIVDYGCGEGELLNYLPGSRIKEYRGWEVNEACLPVARDKWRSKKLHFEKINRQKLPSLGQKSSVDVVILIGVVQYLPSQDLKHVLAEAKRVLKPGGKLLISCTTDHWVYSWLNIYRLFLPHNSVNRRELLQKISAQKLQAVKSFERGLFLTPFFANILVFFFDALDKVLYRTKGELGPIGRLVRRGWAPIIQAEFSWPIDYGYTLFVVAKKIK